MQSTRSLLAFLCIFAGLTVGHAEPVPQLPLDTFFGNARFTQARLSPDGSQIAFLAPTNNRMNLKVLDLATQQVLSITDMREENILSLRWKGDDRIIFTMQYKGQESLGYYAVNSDGTNLQILIQAVRFSAPGLIDNLDRPAAVIDYLDDDPDHILINKIRGNSGLGDIYRMNVHTGRESLHLKNPERVVSWLTDWNGTVRLGVSMDDFRREAKILYRKDAGSDWETLRTLPIDRFTWNPLAFDADNKTLFVASNLTTDRIRIVAFDPELNEEVRVIHEDPVYDVDQVIPSTFQKRVVAVAYQAEKPRRLYLDAELAALQRDIDRQFPDTDNFFSSSTRDLRKLLVYRTSDREPGDFYLLDRDEKTLNPIGRVLPLVDPGQMATMRPIVVTARDGLTLHGYLALPAGREPRNLPLVVNPHGGPWARDTWGFNPEIQFLANRGYAVLQINFRGSTGYGRAFEDAGNQQWGLKMQDDITDAVKWAIAEGFADPDRVAIYGASYGGYATLAGLTMTPELYRCGINYVGVSNIMLLLDGFNRWPKIRQQVYAERIGNPREDRERLRMTSPVNLVENIRVPTLHAYGGFDPRVVIAHGEELRSQLQRHGKPFEYIRVGNEGHGFNKYENRLEFYTAMERFLEANMAPRR